MNNQDVARVFENIAALMKLKGESSFKIRAYTRAAESFEHLPYDVNDLASDEEKLKEIPGIGDAIAKKTHELLSTGSMAFYEDLKKEFPDGILALMDVPEIGPRTALKAGEELGISSLDQLEKSIEDGSFAKLPGVGEKRAQNILRHLQSRANQSSRIPIGRALPVGEKIVEALQAACPDVRSPTLAGSLRRWRETIGDIDILCAAEDPGAVTRAFVNLPMVRDVISRGDTKASVVVADGLQVDLRVTDDTRMGALLLYFTGSQQHGVRLRERAQRLGLSLNEYGLSDSGAGESTAFPTEEDAYAALGLPYIPPELREDAGELEAAEHQDLPALITLDDLRGDLHVHCDWSDGRAAMEDMVSAAKASGLEYVAMTDHSAGRGIANGLSVERLEEHNRAVEETEKRVGGIRVFKGSEVDIRADGTLDYSDEAISTLDVVVASVHSSMQQDAEAMTRRIIGAMKNPHVTAIGHLTTRFVLEREPIQADFDAIFNAAAETGTLLEINASPKRLDINASHIRRARQLGARFLINTDAHSVQELRQARYGVGTARRGWCEFRDVINALPVDEFERFLATPKPERGKIRAAAHG